MPADPRSRGAQRNEFVCIAQAIQQRIETGAIGIGRMLPTERELQEEFSVSRSTIRRALKRLADTGWVNNVPNRGAMASTGTTRARTMNIALIDGGTYVLRVLTHRFSDMLLEYGYHLVHLGGFDRIPIEEPLQYAVENNFDGVIVWPYRGFPDEPTVQRLTGAIPVVSLDHILPGGLTDLVTFDYQSAAEIATTHLIQQGCKRVGVTGMTDMLEVSHQRFRGYMKAMFAQGLQPDSRDFIFTRTSAMPAPDNKALAVRMREPDRPDGWLVYQDECVPCTIEAAIAAGLRVPQDVKLATIGDEIDATVEGVGMTTVALDWDRMASIAVEVLLDRIENRDRTLKTALAPHRLIIRGMCGAPKAEWTPDPDAITGFHGNFPFPRSSYQYSSLWSAPKTDSVKDSSKVIQ